MGNVFGINVEIPLDKVVSCCWREACGSKETLASLEEDWDRLKTTRDDVKTKIEIEERQRKKLLQTVDEWLSRVEAVEAKVDNLIKDSSRESANKCLFGCFSKNCIASYKLTKKVVKMQRGVVALLERKPEVVAEDSLLAPVEEILTDQPVGLESTLDEVWRYIEGEQVGMIGLYGMGGVGKTTLLTAINNKLCNSTLRFDVVIWILVSLDPNIAQIQNNIGAKIGFHSEQWKAESQEYKAGDISSVLSKKKYILLLDDLWKRLDLIKLGVPLPNKINKSKVVFTTRSKEVCGQMEARQPIKVRCLKEEEAWDLFQEKVGQEALNANPEIPELAKVVAKKCGGLPLAIITIGRAMACKTSPQEWHHAIELLKRYTSEFSGMEDEVFPLLKFSYDRLPNDIVRSCLLYCSLYPEHGLISKEDLIDKWICEGFLDKFDNFHKTRNEGHNYIGTLVHASLLEEHSLQEVKMHDMIRDMAIWIGCECGKMKNNFFVQARAGLTKAPKFTVFEGTKRMSIMSNEITELTGRPECPKLLTLFLHKNHCLKMISSDFFQSMPNLRVLDLCDSTVLTRLPREICELVSLKYLNLSNMGLKELPREICELVSLQYLNLSNTGLKELPMEFQKLTKLKYLNLGGTRIHKISEGVLSSFMELQMLNLDGLGGFELLWDGLPKTFVKELENLEHLNELTITITSENALSDFSSSRRLTSFTTSMCLRHLSGSRYLDILFLKEMIRLERLDIRYFKNIEEIMIGKGKATSRIIINQNCFSNLRFLCIFYCPMLKDLTWLAFAPNLEDITISHCPNIKTLVGGGLEMDEDAEEEGHTRTIPFAKLKKLDLQSLPQLESIYPSALPFPSLKIVTVHFGCPKLKKLPFNSSSYEGCGITIEGQEQWWNALTWDDEATQMDFQSAFKLY